MKYIGDEVTFLKRYWLVCENQRLPPLKQIKIAQ